MRQFEPISLAFRGRARLVCAVVASAALIAGGFGVVALISSGQASTAGALVVHGRPPSAGTVWQNRSGETGTVGDTTYSTNWAGFAMVKKNTTSVGGTWIVPSVKASAATRYSATWLGTDGYGNANLIQAGTSQDTSRGTTFYYAWWEVLPDPETAISMRVSPGNKMSVELAKVSATKWRITIKDLTAHETWTGLEPYRGDGSSVEAVEEAPTVNGHVAALANFKIVRFTGGHNDMKVAKPIASEEIRMVNGGRKVIAYPQPPNKSGFSVSYGAPKA